LSPVEPANRHPWRIHRPPVTAAPGAARAQDVPTRRGTRGTSERRVVHRTCQPAVAHGCASLRRVSGYYSLEGGVHLSNGGYGIPYPMPGHRPP